MPPQSDSQHPPKLLERVVERLRVKHYSLRTEKSYVDWIKDEMYRSRIVFATHKIE